MQPSKPVDGTVYSWKLFQKSWAFRWPNFPNRSKGKDVRASFGMWMRFTRDNVVEDQRRRNLPKESNIPEEWTPTTERYEYSQLPQGTASTFRLLRLQPGAQNDPLFAVLETHVLDEAPTYQALSYVWGRWHRSFSRALVHETHGARSGSMAITPNLAAALRALRQNSAEVLLWADSVCINQSDHEEQATQVGIMSQIYSHASQVTVWLGPENKDSAHGMQALRYFVDCSAVPGEARWYSTDGARNGTASQATVNGLKDVLSNRHWWFRVWTLQESALAQRIRLVCGNSAVFWHTDVDTLRTIRFKVKSAAVSQRWKSSDLSQVDLDPLIQVVEAQLRERASEGLCHIEKDILDVSYEFRSRQSSDPRDQMIAMFALAEGRKLNFNELLDYSQTIEEMEEGFRRRIQALYPNIRVQVGI